MATLTIIIWVIALAVTLWSIYDSMAHERKLDAANKAAAKPIKYRRFIPVEQGE